MHEQIKNLVVRAFQIPTDLPESDGTLKWNSTTLVLVQMSAGSKTGLGFTYSHSSAASLIRDKLREEIIGQNPFSIPSIESRLKTVTRDLGSGGIAKQAISAVNFALWDLKARLMEMSLVDLLGSAREGVPVYGSGGFTSYSEEQLSNQLYGWVEEGIASVKMKVGRVPTEDVSRVRQAREAIGSCAELFVDANGAYSRQQALDLADEFAILGVSWFEEPVSSDDLAGLHFLRDHSPAGMEITAGEYGDCAVYFQRMLAAQAVDVQMADGTRCGGVSGLLDVASLCRGAQIPLSAHTAPNLHAHICCALPEVRHVEYFHDHVRIEQMFFDGALVPIRGELQPDRTRPGMGLNLKEPDVQQYEIT